MSATPIELVEVGPRDGLQNEVKTIATETKIELVNSLSRCGFRRIETGSFVSPRWVPQMAGSGDVFKRISRHQDIQYSALVPNLIGLEKAIEAGVDEIAIFVSVSEGFSRANLNASIGESLDTISAVIRRARDHDLRTRGYLSCVVACPYDGVTDPKSVAELAKNLISLGCEEISLGDTIGAGTPLTVGRMLEAVLKILPPSQIAGHFHDTGGSAMANILAAIDYGVRMFDTSIAGLGGCPFAPGASGNAATENVHAALSSAGWNTGLDENELQWAARQAKKMVKNSLEK